MLPVALLLVAITFVYIWLKWTFSYWERNNVGGPKPSLFFGNLKGTMFMYENLGIIAVDWYNEYPDEPYVGYYKWFSPAILLRNIELIKDVLTTNFDNFRNNDFYITDRYDPLFATNPVTKRDDDWKEARKTLSPMFSPNKLKMVVPLMDSVAADFIEFIKSYPAHTDFHARDIAIRYTTENVIKCLFSIQAGCFANEDNEFLMVPKIFTPSFLTALKGLASAFWPNWVADCIPVPVIPLAMDRWFRNFVRTNLKSRSDVNSEDLLEMLRKIQKQKNYDDSFLEGSSFTFFMDGTESSAVAISYALYELARNPQCQEKAYEEVARILSKHDGMSTYEAITEMDYLESVMLEASRLHPPNLFVLKLCTKRYMLPMTKKQNKPIAIEPGTAVLLPILAIHMDPSNYPDPEVFDPERFIDKEQRNKHSFLTFGKGGRVCLGMRFAMFQIKVALAHIVLNFRITPSPMQKQPLVIDAKSVFLSYPKDGLIVRFETR